MKVSSPIGDLPFKPTRLRFKDGTFYLDGSMGAWPAHVQINSADLVDIFYLLRYILLGILIAVGVIVVFKTK